MSFEGFGERALSRDSETDQSFSVVEEVGSGIRRKKVESSTKDVSNASAEDLNGVRGYQVEKQSPLHQMEYLMGVDDIQREAAGFSDDTDSRRQWERAKQRSGGEVAHSIARLREVAEEEEHAREEIIRQSKEQRERFEATQADRAATLDARRKERVEMRAAHWMKDNLRDVASTHALDEDYSRLFDSFDVEGTGDVFELGVVQAKLEGSGSPLHQKGLHYARRSEALAYGEDGVPYDALTGATPEQVDDLRKEGIQTLSSEVYRNAFEVFLRKRYALTPAALTDLRARVEAMDRDRRGTSVITPERKRQIDEKIEEMTARFSDQIVQRFMSGETDGRLGKEAGTRERFQWLENRILGALRASGVLKHVDVSAGALATDASGSDLAYVEIDVPDRASDEEKATIFSRLAMRSPDQWGKEFSPRLQKMPRFAEHVQASFAELALIGPLLLQVGQDVLPYDVDMERGRFSQKTTGDVLSVAGDFKRALPKELAQRMQQMPKLKANVDESLAHRSVAFEIACLHKLAVPEYMRKALSSLSDQLKDETNPLSQLMRRSFGAAFLNTLLAEREYALFVERVSALAQQKTFDPSMPGIVADFHASTQPLVESAVLLGRVSGPEALRDAA